MQMVSFPAGGYLRVTWETKNESRSGAGRFKVILGSAISGRQISTVVDARGPGRGAGYLNEESRSFYVIVESNDIDWKFRIDEGSLGEIESKK